LAASGGLGVEYGLGSVKAEAKSERAQSQEIKSEVADRLQRVVNETQLPRLNQVIKLLGEEILDSRQHQTYLLIDDLDRDWVDDALANLLIRCLFTAVLDMQRVANLKITVALRTNIFQQLQYGEKLRGGQEEKYRSLALHIRWTRNDLKLLMQERTKAACRHYGIQPERTLDELLPRGPVSRESAIDYILDQTLMRPRDAIVYLNEIVRLATGRDRMTWKNIQEARKPYSDDRLLALRDEWKEPYFGIDQVFEQFRSVRVPLSRDELQAVLDNVALLPADPTFRGTPWLTQMFAAVYEAGDRSWPEMYGEITRMLYGLGFLGSVEGREEVYYHVEPYLIESSRALETHSRFTVHPAFRPALSIRDPKPGTFEISG
jgi:hypothetical protein